MGFIVYNRDTGGYLKKHSGSYRYFRRRASYDIQKELKENGIPQPPIELPVSYDKYWSIIHEGVIKRIFSADAKNAREYANRQGALTSVGLHGRKLGDKVKMPDNLEIHEIEVVEMKITIPVVSKGELK